MRAVALSDKNVQKKIAKSFVPLKVTIPYGSKKFPLDWPGLKVWQDTHRRMGSEKCEGLTACSVINLDLNLEMGSTGSAFVWELFDSIAYDANKFAKMLDNALERFEQEQKIRADKSLSDSERKEKIAKHHRNVRRQVAAEGSFHFPPKGFTIEGAKELFRLSGDLKDGQ